MLMNYGLWVEADLWRKANISLDMLWSPCIKRQKPKACPQQISAQKAELIITLTQALELGKGKTVTTYIDSKYVFSVIHTHGAIWKEKGLLSAANKETKEQRHSLTLRSHPQTQGNNCNSL